MSARLAIVVAAMFVGLMSSGPAFGKPAAAKESASAGSDDLELQVAAMTKLHEMDLSSGQLKQLKAIAAQVEPGKAPAATKASQAYRTALSSLRDALGSGDDDKIDSAEDRLDTVRDQEKLAVAADPEISDSARKQASAATALLSLSQLASYVAANEDDIADPVEQMMDALDQLADKPSAEEYAGIRSELASEVSVLVAGLDKAAQESVARKVGEWLDGAHAADVSSLDAKRGSYERSARQIVGKTDAFHALHNWMQREMATLLSNPTLPAAIDEIAKGTSE